MWARGPSVSRQQLQVMAQTPRSFFWRDENRYCRGGESLSAGVSSSERSREPSKTSTRVSKRHLNSVIGISPGCCIAQQSHPSARTSPFVLARVSSADEEVVRLRTMLKRGFRSGNTGSITRWLRERERWTFVCVCRRARCREFRKRTVCWDMRF